MGVYFLDASAAVKRYVNESGSERVTALTAAANEIFVSKITAVEFASAVARRRREGTLDETIAAAAAAEFQQDFSAQYRAVDVSSGVIARAVVLTYKHGLRAYDAVQLATAVEVSGQGHGLSIPPLVFVSADRDLNVAASLEGLAVEDPSGVGG